MKINKNKILKIILFFILFHNFSLKAHNSINGGCQNHCYNNDETNSMQINKNNKNDKDKMIDKFSCLNKSLCRG